MDNTRERKIISFTKEYEYELAKLSNEKNGSRLVCELLREYYKGGYNMEQLGEDIKHIKEVLDEVLKGLGAKA